MISHKEYGGNCNTILTTNFDDMVADALYLYTNKKPLVIAHESLIGFVRNNRERPLVLKLHGDAHLEPKNTEVEVEKLDDAVKKAFNNLLAESGLIFLGYGGNDNGILDALKGLPWGVYWVNRNLPNQAMQEWLEERKATWVKHRDFDEAMVLHREQYGLNHPTSTRLEILLIKYFETFRIIGEKLKARSDSEEKVALDGAFEEAKIDFTGWQALELEVRKYKYSNPEKVKEIYLQSIIKSPNNFRMMGSFAYYLHIILDQDYDMVKKIIRTPSKSPQMMAST